MIKRKVIQLSLLILLAQILSVCLSVEARAYDNGATGVVNEFGGRVYWCIDTAETIGQSIHLRGWAYDTVAKGSSLNMHLYCGTGANGSADPHGGFSTNITRTDVNSAFGLSGAHGFDLTFATRDAGTRRVQLFTFYADGTDNGGTPVPIWDKSMTFRQEYAVTYNANGGSGAPAKQTKINGVTLKLSTTVPTWTGHTFLGWSTSAAGNVSYQPGGNYTGNAALPLYAIWQEITYTVSYDANGGDSALEPQTKQYEKPLTITGDIPTKSDHAFIGWGLSADAQEASYQPYDTYTDNADLALFALWTYVRIPGDVNGDHAIDGRDALRLLKYLADTSVAVSVREQRNIGIITHKPEIHRSLSGRY